MIWTHPLGTSIELHPLRTMARLTETQKTGNRYNCTRNSPHAQAMWCLSKMGNDEKHGSCATKQFLRQSKVFATLCENMSTVTTAGKDLVDNLLTINTEPRHEEYEPREEDKTRRQWAQDEGDEHKPRSHQS